MLKRVKKLLHGPGLRAELLRGAIGSVGIKMGSVLIGLVLAVILARFLGPEGYGTYVYVFSLVTLLAIPSQLGLPNLIIRETAKAEADGEWGLMRGLWRFSMAIVGGISLVLIVLAVILGYIFNAHFTNTQMLVFAFGMALVLVMALNSIYGAALRGLRHVVMGQFPIGILCPGLLAVFLFVLMVSVSPMDITASEAMGLHVIAALVSLVIGILLLRRVRPKELADYLKKPIYTVRPWLVAAIPLAMSDGMLLINRNIGVLILGPYASATEVGIFKIALTGAALVNLGLTAIATVVMPYFSRFYTEGDMKRLQRLVTLSARAGLIISLPFVLLFVFFGDTVLTLFFGEEYVSGYIPLAIIAVGQLVSASFGSVGALLAMTGHEWDITKSAVVAVIVNVLLTLVLVPFIGMIGAALAAAAGLIIWNVIMWKIVQRRLGIEASAFKVECQGD